ncbi:MAG: GH1 family beta-glucosidase [Sciscionella sp.]
MDFPGDFLWGVATAAFQIEGAVREGGRGVSVWDTFCATAGKVANGDNAEIACDHYHRYPEDIRLLTELGAGAYRFSLAWPRIQPTGTGAANPAGLDFYDRLIDALCAEGIAPVATLYHWDTPQPLEDTGGWLNRDTASRFADYAAIVGEQFADRVAMWIPVNEPVVTTLYGYAIGEYAPGRTLMFDAIPAAHHQNLAHGLAVSALRAAGAKACGTANNHSPIWPAEDTAADNASAAALDALLNGLFADPMLLGSYPEQMLGYLPRDYADDLPTIAQPLDFYGVNYYEPQGVSVPTGDNVMPFEMRPLRGYPVTTNGSPVVPAGLTDLLVSFHKRYGPSLPPIYITENGCAYDGVADPERIEFMRGHLEALRAAMAAGVDVRGYFAWSLLDNFEWSKGYQPRFGLVHVDFHTQRRTPKDSFKWYRDLIGGSQ